MTSKDRRVRRTKHFLEEGLLQLMQEKKIKHITVRELTERVDINRSTFYLHYLDIYDMVEKIEQKLIDEFYEELTFDSAQRTMEDDVYHFMETAIEVLRRNKRTVRILCSENGDHMFIDRLTDVTYKQANLWLRSILGEDTEHQRVELAVAFFCTGCVSLLTRWLRDEDMPDAEETLQLMFRLVLKGADGFLENH